jgi:hypothetical protein
VKVQNNAAGDEEHDGNDDGEALEPRRLRNARSDRRELFTRES